MYFDKSQAHACILRMATTRTLTFLLPGRMYVLVPGIRRTISEYLTNDKQTSQVFVWTNKYIEIFINYPLHVYYKFRGVPP